MWPAKPWRWCDAHATCTLRSCRASPEAGLYPRRGGLLGDRPQGSHGTVQVVGDTHTDGRSNG
jgi:hypothetical protein